MPPAGRARSLESPGAGDRACERIGRDPAPLVYASKTAAKVDSAAVQDGYQLYHHAFFFTTAGEWCVVQQGMSDATRTARRYHWLSEHVSSFVEEPHEAVCCDAKGETLNLVTDESAGVRRGSVELAIQPPEVVDRATYDKTVEILGLAINKAAIGRTEKVQAFRRLTALGKDDTP